MADAKAAIRRLMERRGIGSVVELAEKSGVSRTHIYALWERPDATRLGTLRKLAKALRAPIAAVVGDLDADVIPSTPYETNADYRALIDMVERIPRARRPEFLAHVLAILRMVVRDGAHEAEERHDISMDTEEIANVSKFPERTIPRWTPEFPVQPSEFNDAGDTDFPLELHAYELEDLDETGVSENLDMPTKLLSSREVRSGQVRTVRVRGNDVAPYREGWKLAIDVTIQDASLIDEDEAVIAYRKDKGMWLGRVHRAGGHTLVRKDTGESIDMSDGYRLVGVVDDIVHAPQRKQRGKR